MLLHSICIVCKEYPPDTAASEIGRGCETLARGLAQRGVAVHVVARSCDGEMRRIVQDGVTVHRLAEGSVIAPDPDLPQLVWAERVASLYAQLDAQVRFDVVLASERGAETLKLVTHPHTAVVLRLDGGRAVVDPERNDWHGAPGYALASQMELLALGRADALIAPSQRIRDATAALQAPSASVLPPLVDFGPREPTPTMTGREATLVYIGRLHPSDQPELALRCLARFRERESCARLIIVGPDAAISANSDSYVRSVLSPLAERLGIDPTAVDYIGDLDSAGLRTALQGARAAIAPARDGNVPTAALEALARGLPVFSGPDSGLAEWIAPDEGLLTFATEDLDRSAEFIVDRVVDPGWCDRLGVVAADRVRAVFDSDSACAAYIRLFDGLVRKRLSPSSESGPRLGIIVSADDTTADTLRAVESVRRHTATPFRLVVVAKHPAEEIAAHLSRLDDPRIAVVGCPVDHGVAGARNAGLDALGGDEDYVVFLDSDVEVLEDWWAPFIGVLESDRRVGIAGDQGMHARWHHGGRDLIALAGPGERCDVVAGYCMMARSSALARIGRFDERLTDGWWDDDLALRAARIDEHVVAVQSGRVLHFAHHGALTSRGESADARPHASRTINPQQIVAAKYLADLACEGRIVLLADANEAADNPQLLHCWARSFTADDAATLVLYGPGLDPATYVAALSAIARDVGLDLEDGPSLIAKLPAVPDDQLEASLSDQAIGCLGHGPRGPSFRHLARFDPGNPDALRVLAARAWAISAERGTTLRV